MGTTLENGVYLPSEGERNCYAGLKTNWEILDQKVADVTALQQAVAGALHREIVESLPTTDIDPNTIYMILSGTSATENVYNEFMYVNNAWELIGTSATDLTNYYTKAEVDGKLLLKANASDLTSHTGDTTIHVTTADKTKWNNGVSQSYVLRYSSSSVTDNSTIAFSTLDNIDNIKSGDKVIDVDGKIFSIVSVDTANQTVTVGSALIDLAQDSDVVHKSGNETISGVKTITNTNLEFKSTSGEYGVSAGDSSIIFRDKNNLQIFKIYSRVFFSGVDNNLISFFITQKVDNTYYNSNGIQLYTNTGNKDVILRPIPANNNADGLSVSLGASDRRWSKIYGTEYYYGSNNVEFSTKFVTTDTAQTITESKTFSSDLSISNTDTTANTPSLRFRNYKVARGSTVEIGGQILAFLDKGGLSLGSVESRVLADGGTALRLYSFNKDSGNQTISSSIDLRKYSDGSVYLIPDLDNDIWLGNTLKKWKGIFTNQINSLTPSSLGMPSDRSARIDISGYITNLGNGDNNQYIVPANGYIWLHFTSINSALCYSQTSGGLTNYAQTFVRYQGDGQLYAFFPVRKDDYFIVQIYTSSTAVVQNAYFIPCQGNV